jgi:hypothetical protein
MAPDEKESGNGADIGGVDIIELTHLPFLSTLKLGNRIGQTCRSEDSEDTASTSR